MKRNLIISIPSLWALRNFIYTNIASKLKESHELYFLTLSDSEINNIITREGYNTINYVVKPNNTFQKSIIKSLTKKIIRKHKNLGKSRLIQLSLQRFKGIRGICLQYAELALSILPEKILLKLYKINIIYKIDSKIHKLLRESTTLISTNFVVKHEMDIFLVLDKSDSTTINFVNSFDNTTSRGYIPFHIFNYHIVWNMQMKQELSKIFNINSLCVLIMGTPQFDLLKEGSQLELDTTDNIYEIIEKSPYVLYCAGHYSLLPFEVQIVQELIDVINRIKEREVNIIIRLHPLDDYDRWKMIIKQYNNVYIDIPWKQNLNNPLESVPERYEYTRHGRIINNALMIFNIGSTSTLDACILDRPVYNLYFNNYNNSGSLDLIYNSEHFSTIINSGAAPLVSSYEKIEEILRSSSHKCDELSKRRILLANSYCGYDAKNKFVDRFYTFIESL